MFVPDIPKHMAMFARIIWIRKIKTRSHNSFNDLDSQNNHKHIYKDQHNNLAS
jgi:hypothetical protein